MCRGKYAEDDCCILQNKIKNKVFKKKLEK